MTSTSPKIKLPDIPLDGFTVEYWMVESSGNLAHYRAIYYKNTDWKDHPWSSSDRGANYGGAPFVDEWSISVKWLEEEEFRGVGRISRWANLGAIEGSIYTSELLALEDLRGRLEDRLRRAEEDVVGYKSKIAAVSMRIEMAK